VRACAVFDSVAFILLRFAFPAKLPSFSVQSVKCYSVQHQRIFSEQNLLQLKCFRFTPKNRHMLSGITQPGAFRF
jgi:hypothetical protein